jgi:methyl-accepting chemotaxis protein
MNRRVLRFSWLVLLGLLFVSGENRVARAQAPQPADVLKNRGLHRAKGSPAHWVLEDEAVVLRKFQTVKSLAAQFEAAQNAQRELANGHQDPGELIEYCRTQMNLVDQRINVLDQELANLGASGGNQAAVRWHNILVEERNAMVREHDRLGTVIRSVSAQRGEIEQVNQQFAGELERARRSYKERVVDLRALVDTVLKNYDKVGKKEDVAKAISDLSKSSKTRQKIGPSRDLQAAIRWLERSERSRSQRYQRPRSGRGRL